MIRDIKQMIHNLGPPVVFFIVVLTIWQGVVAVFHVPPYLLPSPSAVLRILAGNSVSLFGHTLTTMVEAVAGFVLANLLGFGLAVVFAHSRTIERAVYPYAIALKTTPIVAMAPLLVLWLGTGILSKIVASALICFFPILVNATRGMRAIDEEALDLFRSLDATKLQVFVKLRLPSSMPYVFAAFRISTSLSVVGAIVGEFVGAQRGLGYLIVVSSYHLETDVMFAAVIMAAAAGVVFFGLFSLLEKLIVSWTGPIQEQV